MLKNLFKSESTVQDEKPNAQVKAVHREFLTASDDILKEARDTVNRRILEKSDRLQSFGFGYSQDVEASMDLHRKAQVADVIEKYAVSHPLNRVISGQAVDRICEKYGLIMGKPSSFTGFVPEKNLKEIEAFKFTGKYRVNEVRFISGWSGNMVTTLAEYDTFEEAQKHIRAKDDLSRRAGFAFASSILEVNSPKDRIIIVAPKKDMRINPGERIVDHQIVAVPDPVVLFPVESNCYLIVTAWGDEASDPDVVNPKMN